MTLLDSLIPNWNVRTRHSTGVAAPAERVARAIEEFRPASDSSAITRLLVRARGLRSSPGTLREALKSQGFTAIAETPGREIVFAVAGRFWSLREQRALERVEDAEAFRHYEEPGCAAAALSVALEPLEGGKTLLATETRVRCVDAAARLRFRLYWMIVGPFSGMIRRDWLRAIKRLAEHASLQGPRSSSHGH